LYCLIWAIVLPWTIWKLATSSLSAWEYAGLGVSFWIVVSLNTAIAHELIHAGRPIDRALGVMLDATVGYFHFPEEHLSHHERTGHYVGGDAAKPGTSIYRFALTRYWRTFGDAWAFERSRLQRLGKSWYANRLLGRGMVPFAIGAVFYHFAGWTGLVFYCAQVVGAAFSVQAITYLQHWGLSQLKTPEVEDYGFSWEDGCWMQACVTLNHAYHGQHHLNLRQPYYKLSLPKDALCLPASYPVMFLMALYPPVFTKVMTARLERWRANVEAREEMMHDNDCIGAARLARQLKKG
jgi:alkane 1-monooxygenase